MKHYPHPDIVERINEVLTDRGSDGWWASKLGLQRKTVMGYRHGYSSMKVETLRMVCAISGVRAEWILWGSGNKYA